MFVPPPRPWCIDAGVARDLAELVGWTAGEGPVALVGALADHIPVGTTAKLEAVATGDVPAGADPEAIARRILDDRVAGRPGPSWSCWAMSSVMAALSQTMAEVQAHVAAIRRIDERSLPVDLHSVVVVDGSICDPYFCAVVPGPGDLEIEGVHRGVWAQRSDEPDGRWSFEVGNCRWSARLRYRLLAPVTDRGDVAAFCALSVTHTGVPPGPFASVWRAEVAVDAFVHEAGGAAVREWRRAGPDTVWEGIERRTEHPSWDLAVEDLSARTGLAIR